MKPVLLSATAAALLFGAAAASADCREELAALEGGISKDGSLAPLQSPGEATPQTGGDAAAAGTEAEAQASEAVAKDASKMPLGADSDIAMSGQDAQAQSEGGETAAAQAEGAPGGSEASERDQALARAQAALDAGDEVACMKELEQAKSM